MNIEKVLTTGLCTAAALFGGGLAVKGFHDQHVQDTKFEQCDNSPNYPYNDSCYPTQGEIDGAAAEAIVGLLLLPAAAGAGLVASARNQRR